MSSQRQAHPTLRQRYAGRLEEDGEIVSGEADAMISEMYNRLLDIQTAFGPRTPHHRAGRTAPNRGTFDTGVAALVALR